MYFCIRKTDVSVPSSSATQFMNQAASLTAYHIVKGQRARGPSSNKTGVIIAVIMVLW